MRITRHLGCAVPTAIALLLGCGGSIPDTRYYQLAPPTASAPRGALVVVLEAFETDAGYDDDRIVYRTTPYRFDYYQYHRWSAPPSVMVANFLEQALERSGQFGAVVHEASEQSPVALRGRVLAIEEVDQSPSRRSGRIVLELTAIDVRSGSVVWSEQFEELEQLRVNTPEGLAQALSIAMTRIARRATAPIAEHAARVTAADAAGTGLEAPSTASAARPITR